MSKNWTKTTTGKGRYDVIGVCDYIRQYAKNTSKEKIRMIDVGCSKAVAIKECEVCLKEENVSLFTVGIDVSEKVKDEAEENLSEFILGDVTRLSQKNIKQADIVICLHVTIRIDIGHRDKIIKKCIY